jgi:hypothetical protein
VLDALLAKYQDEGVLNLDDANVFEERPVQHDGQLLDVLPQDH